MLSLCVGGRGLWVVEGYLVCAFLKVRVTTFVVAGRSVELRRAGSGLLDRVVADTRSLKQIPLTEISSEMDSGLCYVCLFVCLFVCSGAHYPERPSPILSLRDNPCPD